MKVPLLLGLLLVLLPATRLRAADDDCCDGRKKEPTAEEVAQAAFRSDLAATVALADEVELFSLATVAQRQLPPEQRFEIGPDGSQFMLINQRLVLPDAARKEFLGLFTALLRDPDDHGGGATTHQPKYGVRLRKGGREILATSFSWESRNFWLRDAAGAAVWAGFNPAAMRAFFEKSLPEPGVVQLLAKTGMIQGRGLLRPVISATAMGEEIKIEVRPQGVPAVNSTVAFPDGGQLSSSVTAASYGTNLRKSREWFALIDETGRVYLGEVGHSVYTYDYTPGQGMDVRSLPDLEKAAILEKYQAAKKQSED